MSLESEIENQRKRIMMLESHIAVLQRKLEMVEDSKARNAISRLVTKLVNKKLLSMDEHDWVFKQ